MPVYFIQAGDDGPIKIGWSKEVRRRISKMQADNPVPLKILAVEDADKQVETAYHLKFDRHRLGGEWFSPAPEILNQIANLPSPDKNYVRRTLSGRLKSGLRNKPKREPVTSVIGKIIEAAGGIPVVAEKTGLKDGVRKWAQIGIPDRYWPVLIKLVPSLTLDELYAANRQARGAFQPSGKNAA